MIQTQVQVPKAKLEIAIAAAQNYLLNIQDPEGYWWGELESNVTITAEVVLLHKIWGTDKQRPLDKAETYLRSGQKEHGGWELFYGDGGDLSTSVEAYMALKLLGVSKNDRALEKARDFIIDRGGISKTRIFTKLHLAVIGCYQWRGIPSIPPWVMFVGKPFPVSIYEMSSWARSSTVPLLIVFDRKPVFEIEPKINLDELYAEGIDRAEFELPRQNDWTDIFVWADDLFKLAENLDLVPFREEGIKAAEKWILERQEASGDWGGIIPAMLNSLLALRCLNYDVHDPIVVRGLQSIDRFALETNDSYRIQPCVSPVWDTAWAVRALLESGLAADNPALVKAGEWLIDKQILDYGDWAYKNTEGKPGAWAFEFDNRFYPDVDDSAVVIMALADLQLPNQQLKQTAIDRGMNWIASMQCQEGGWAAFDLDNNQDWINLVPYADLKAMIDPNTADVTARVLEMVGYLKGRRDGETGRGTEIQIDRNVNNSCLTQSNYDRAIDYLLQEQESAGCWFGRWGVNYIYGTSGALSALALVAPQTQKHRIARGADWLINCQNSDGGWGETCRSYDDPSLKGKGVSTPSQTAWALIGLMAAGEATGRRNDRAIRSGVNYLLSTQTAEGTWYEAEFTGTGFPGHFYLKYHLYQHYFPTIALSRYQHLSN
jgi:squalene-hopene/tetraprenyl-beta-curcumene cyclase